jgi:hypothetical protein
MLAFTWRDSNKRIEVLFLDLPHGFDLLRLVPAPLELRLMNSVDAPHEGEQSQTDHHCHVYSELMVLRPVLETFHLPQKSVVNPQVYQNYHFYHLHKRPQDNIGDVRPFFSGQDCCVPAEHICKDEGEEEATDE